MIKFTQYPEATEIIIPDNIKLSTNNFDSAFSNMTNITDIYIHNKVTDIASACYGCTNLKTAICCPNVVSMDSTYYGCTNLTTAVCGPNVKDMSYAYCHCTNLTEAACGENVTKLAYAYINCTNLTTAVCGPNVTDMYRSYRNCTNIQGDVYLMSNNITDIEQCFQGRDSSNRLNIYVTDGSTSLATCLTNNSKSMTGTTITWTDDIADNNCYYNATQNIYIYPVANVEEARIANSN